MSQINKEKQNDNLTRDKITVGKKKLPLKKLFASPKPSPKPTILADAARQRKILRIKDIFEVPKEDPITVVASQNKRRKRSRKEIESSNRELKERKEESHVKRKLDVDKNTKRKINDVRQRNESQDNVCYQASPQLDFSNRNAEQTTMDVFGELDALSEHHDNSSSQMFSPQLF